MSQNTRLLLVALVVLVAFGIFLQSLIARSLQDTFGADKGVPEVPQPRSPYAQKGDPPPKRDADEKKPGQVGVPGGVQIPKPVPAKAK
ncbi:MAG: hypothetical protein IPM23_16925 [Candidatus Melainabacteria bacterium]|nr:hypothetical protein [Candidatus Melainabacteria bacterium]